MHLETVKVRIAFLFIYSKAAGEVCLTQTDSFPDLSLSP